MIELSVKGPTIDLVTNAQPAAAGSQASSIDLSVGTRGPRGEPGAGLGMVGLSGTPAKGDIIVALNAISAIWQQDVYINVKSRGVIGFGLTDESDAIQAIIDEADDEFYIDEIGTVAWGRVVYFPVGIYMAEGLIVPKHVKLLGAGRGATIFVSPPGSSSPIISFGVIGGSQFCGIAKMSFIAHPDNDNQDAIFINAVGDTYGIGGLWTGLFEDISISGFQGCGIWIRSYNTNGLINQFLTFNKVEITRPNNSDARCLRINNQTGQISFNDCIFDGTSINQGGYNIFVGRDIVDPGIGEGSSGPYAIHFKNCTIQSSSYGAYLDSTFNASFEKCYLEQVKYGVTFAGQWGGSVTGTSFTNAASDGEGGGYGVKAQDGAKVVVGKNTFAGNVDRTYDIDKTNGYTAIISEDGLAGTFDNDSYAPSFGPNTLQLAVSSSTLNTGPNTTVIATGTSVIRTINSHLYTGSVLVIKALGSDLNFGGGGNIYNVDEPTTVPLGQYAVFVRFDLSATWTLVGLSQTDLAHLSNKVARFFEGGITGNGWQVEFDIPHGLSGYNGSGFVNVQVWENFGNYREVFPTKSFIVGLGSVRIVFPTAPAIGENYRVVVIGQGGA